jgi:hypothetical protein
VVGRVGQRTIVGPNGQKMSMSAAARMAGLSARTVIQRIHSGLDPALWFYKGNLHEVMAPAFRITVKRGQPLEHIRGVDDYVSTDNVRNRRRERARGDQTRLGRKAEEAAREAARAARKD